MTEKRFYYNTFYHYDDMDRVLEYEIIDRESYLNYPNHDESKDIAEWVIYIGENDSGWQDMVVDLLNDQDDRIKELEEENEKLKEIFMEQVESALSFSFVKEVYCNALLRILDENDSVEESKKFIKDYLFGDDLND